MELLTDMSGVGFDTGVIRRGDMIRAKYAGWETPCNGIVAYVKPEKIRVLYLTATGYVSNFFTIHLSDVLDGLWEIQWGGDFENVSSYAPPDAGNTETDAEEEENAEP